MASLNQNIIVFKNRYHIIQFTVDGVEDLIGFSAYWAVSSTAGGSPIITKSTEGGTPKITFDALKIIIVIDESDFTSETAGKFYHELVLVDDASKVIQGSIGEVDLRDVTITVP